MSELFSYCICWRWNCTLFSLIQYLMINRSIACFFILLLWTHFDTGKWASFIPDSSLGIIGLTWKSHRNLLLKTAICLSPADQGEQPRNPNSQFILQHRHSLLYPTSISSDLPVTDSEQTKNHLHTTIFAANLILHQTLSSPIHIQHDSTRTLTTRTHSPYTFTSTTDLRGSPPFNPNSPHNPHKST